MDRLSEELKFLKRWAKNPMGHTSVGSIKPSSQALAELMASHIDPNADLPVVELGPGTGVFTKAILKRGLPPEKLYLVEYDDDFYQNLKQNFPKVNIMQGDAYDFKANLERFGINQCSAVLSGLPILMQPIETRNKMGFEIIDALSGDSPFVQFSYGPKAPWPIKDETIKVEKSKWVTLNLPPARVWTYRKIS
jgi:phosphatidylethanolamine/phosphatidyl-N-methylethanolamine N-methyltransferase